MIHLPPCDSDGKAIGVEIQPLLLRPTRLGIVLVDNPAENIRDIWRVLINGISIVMSCPPYLETPHLDPLLHLLRNPRLEPHILGPQNRQVPNDPERPHDVPKHPEHEHVAVQRPHGVVRLAAVQHPEALAQGKVAHDVERVEVEPQRGVEWLLVTPAHVGVDVRDELVRVVRDARLVVAQRFGAEAPVPDLAPCRVPRCVTVRLDGALWREDLVPWSLQAPGVKVDCVEGLWAGDGQRRRALVGLC